MLLELGELLTKTDGRYRAHLAMEIALLRDLVRAEGVTFGDSILSVEGRVIEFRRPAASTEVAE